MDLGQPLEASRDRRGRPAPRRPFLFQLHLHFVLEERIGIEEIGAEQLLTSGVAREVSRHAVSAGIDRSGSTCGTDRAPLRSLAYGLALLSDQNTFAISANIPINQHASMSLSPRSSPARKTRTALCETSRCLVLTRALASTSRTRNLFCIRLHFVLEERIGVGKISENRFLTIDETACAHVFAGRHLR